MAGETLTVDFVGRGATRLQDDIRKIGDNSAIAARGARLLADSIEKQRRAADTSAGATIALAKADEILKEAEHGLADGALEAEFALKREAAAEKEAARDALEAAAANKRLGDSFDKVAEKAGGPSLKGALAALSPALIPVSGGIAAGVGAIGVSFGAAALGAGLFAKAASSVLGQADTNLKKLQALELKVNTARTAAQKKAAEQQVAALKATWSKGYLAMLDALDGFKTKWQEVSQAIAVPALTAGLRALVDGLDFLKPAVIPVAQVFTQWGQAIDRYFTSNAGSAEITRLATAFGRFSASQLRAIGVFVVDIGRGVFNLGRDLAGHNLDFGTFGKHLDEWGAAFARWSRSAAARQDVNRFLAYLHDNGPAVAGLLKNLGGVLRAFAPGLSGLGQLELKLVSDFLGFLARTPKFIAQPLIETAGALLLLQKTGVLSIGIKVVGAAAKWLSGGVISIGSGATAAAEMRAAFTSGGAAAAAEIRAALAGGSGAAGVGAAGAGAAAGKAAGGGFLASFRAALTPAAAGVIAGALIRAAGDTLSPKGTFAGKLNKNFQDDGHLWSTSLLHSFTFGGLEAWLTTKIGLPVGKVLNDILGGAKIWGGNLTKNVTGTFSGIGSFIHGSWQKTQHDTSSIWGNITGFLSGSWRKLVGGSSSTTSGISRNFSGMSNTILGAMRRAGQASDAFRTRNLLPILGTAGRVSGGIQGLQRSINALHGKTVNVGVHGSGSGGVQVTPSSGVPGAKNYAVYFKPLARGGRLPGFGGGDQHPALLESGEAVIDKYRTRRFAPVLKAMGVPGMAGGGLAGAQSAIAAGSGVNAAAETRPDIRAILAKIRAAIAASQAAGAGIRSTALGGDEAANRELARRLFPWPASMWPAFVDLEMREAGFNRFARNPSSGAYGIPQALPPTKLPFAGQAAGGSHAGPQLSWMFSYIAQRYRNPVAADQHELAYHWYDRGGLLKPGLTLAYNGTGRPEMVVPSGGGAGGVHLHLTVNGPVGSQAELENWFVQTANRTARIGRLTQAVKTAAR